MTIDQVKGIENAEETGSAATCECGKLLADCKCAKGEECECGGDPALCNAESVNTIEITVPAPSP